MPEAIETADLVAEALRQSGVTHVYRALLTDDTLRQRVHGHAFDAMVVLGGDGTMLRAGRLCATSRLPIMGINMGSIGFLMEVQSHNWQDKIEPFTRGTSSWKTA